MNLNRAAWRQLVRNWHPSPSLAQLQQRFLAAPAFSALEAIQNVSISDRPIRLDGAIVILGYWRSGTTLLHELLSLDPARTYPTTYACMNPHHFVLTQAQALARPTREVARPMDSVIVRADSPQEDEFALLGLGARSPYEGVLFPSRFEEALALADLKAMRADEAVFWKRAFLQFVRGVAYVGRERPLVLKSPAHGYRIETLAALLPGVRFVSIVRDPTTVFESAVRMWDKLISLYAHEAPISKDRIRQAVLADRVRFEQILRRGLSKIPDRHHVSVHYESLVADPVGTLTAIYDGLALEGFEPLRQAAELAKQRLAAYVPSAARPNEPWMSRLAAEWRDIYHAHDYRISA